MRHTFPRFYRAYIDCITGMRNKKVHNVNFDQAQFNLEETVGHYLTTLAFDRVIDSTVLRVPTPKIGSTDNS